MGTQELKIILNQITRRYKNMRLLAVVAIVILALALADARAPRRMQRRDRQGMMARRLMNNRGVGSKPMSMKRFPYIPAARRAVVNATADGKNATFFGKNETVPGKNDTFHGKNVTDDGGRGNSTDGGDKIEEALWNVYESFVGLYGSFWSLENLELVCTTDLDPEYKRDEYDEYVENLFVNQMNEAADAGKKTQGEGRWPSIPVHHVQLRQKSLLQKCESLSRRIRSARSL